MHRENAMKKWNYNGGFTLVEAMIVLSILTILVSLAIPSYTNYVVRSNRTEAIESLLAASACQERLFIRNNAFSADRCGGATPNGFYTITFALSNSNRNFVATAAPQGSQTRDGCGSLTLSDTGIKKAAGKSGDFATKCWAGKYSKASS